MIYCFIVDSLCVLKQAVLMTFYSIFMFYSMVDKCMNKWQKFSAFWQQAGHMETYIVLINTNKQVR